MPTEKPDLTIGVDLRALVGTPTGIGFYTLSMLEHLAAIGELRLVGMAHKQPQHSDRLQQAGVAIEVESALSGVVWQQTRVPRRLRAGDIDLFWSPILTLPLSLPVPGITTVHDLTPLLYPETHRLKVRLSILPFLRRNLASAAAVVADSQSTADDIRHHYPASSERIEVIYPGIDDIFQPAEPAQIEATRERLGCPQGYFLYSGTLEPRKNLDLLLDAWEAARSANPDCPPLILTGPAGWARKSLFRRLEELRDRGVQWLGRVPRAELVEIMQAARWFVYPSIYEGFGLPVAEAMACGVPPIVSRASSLPEIVGDIGHTIDPADAGELSRLLQRLATAGQDEVGLGLAARERSRRFDWSQAAAMMHATFRRVGERSM